MKKLISLLTVLFLLTSCGDSTEEQSSQETTEEGETTFYFYGLLDDEYGIYMQLNIPDSHNGEVSGEYFYETQQKLIALSGKIEGENLDLDESFEGKITGSFNGLIDDSHFMIYAGAWSDPKEKTHLGFHLDEIHQVTYEAMLNAEQEDVKIMSWDKLLSKFTNIERPFLINLEKDEEKMDGGIDTNTVKKYFEGTEEYLEWGWNEFHPRYKFETDNYIALVLEHFYSPGVGGVNDTYIELYTYEKNGDPIDREYIGCYCSDSNYDDYFIKNDLMTFESDGNISIVSANLHATMVDEGDPEYFEDEVDTSYSFYSISSSGAIQEER